MVLDGIVSTIVGIIGFALMVRSLPLIAAMLSVHPVNSVNPKLNKHGNTEPSVKACVENGHGASLTDEGTFRTLWKHSELSRNAITYCFSR